MSRATHWYLNQVDLFKGISDKEMMQIADKIVEKECLKKELLYTPFEENDSICILKKGEVTLYYSRNGKRLVLDVLKPGSIFGNISFEPKKSNHFAEVTEDAYICLLPVEDFLKVVQAKPQIMIKLLQVMSNQISDYERKLEGGLLDAKEKVLRLLQDEKKSVTTNVLNNLFGSTKKLTHSKIAEQTGLSRETVTRALSDLKKEGKL
jgi:CRP/FNR family transcriptional regulator, cyclic AMP receptor protein